MQKTSQYPEGAYLESPPSSPHLRKEIGLLLERVERELEGEDREAVLRFHERLRAEGASLSTQKTYLFFLPRIRAMLGKPFREATREDVERVLAAFSSSTNARGGPLSPHTLSCVRRVLKRFYRWLLGNDEVFPPCVSWIKCSPPRGRLPRDSLLTEEEVMAMVGACTTPRDRAIVLVLAEAGIRASELLTLRLGDVRFDRYGALLNVRGKTGDRTVRVVVSAPALSAWMDHHPRRGEPSAPLITTPQGKPLSYSGLLRLLKVLATRAGIKKRVHPHGFRHSAATRLARVLTEAELREYFGWSASSQVPAVYVHLSSRDVDRTLLKHHGLLVGEEKEEGMTVIRCPRCSQPHPPGVSFCNRCGLPLSVEGMKEAERRRALLEALEAKLGKDPRLEKVKELLVSLVEDALLG